MLFDKASITIVLILAVSCSQKTRVPHRQSFQLTKTTSVLVNKNWREKSVILERSYPDTLRQEIAPQFSPVDQDDLLFFSTDGTYRFDEGYTKSDLNHKQIFHEGRWQFKEKEKILELTADGSTTAYHLIELSQNKLVLRLDITNQKEQYSYLLYFENDNQPGR